jgi:hypothetical protein
VPDDLGWHPPNGHLPCRDAGFVGLAYRCRDDCRRGGRRSRLLTYSLTPAPFVLGRHHPRDGEGSKMADQTAGGNASDAALAVFDGAITGRSGESFGVTTRSPAVPAIN